MGRCDGGLQSRLRFRHEFCRKYEKYDRTCWRPGDSLPLVRVSSRVSGAPLGQSPLSIPVTSSSPVSHEWQRPADQSIVDPIKVHQLVNSIRLWHCSVIRFIRSGHNLQTSMPRILPRLIKALQRPPGPFEDELRIAPGLQSKARRKRRVMPPHKRRIPIRVSRPAAEYSRSLLLDEESQVRKRKGPPPVVKYQGQDGVRLMNEDELRWWSNPYRAYVSSVLITA